MTDYTIDHLTGCDIFSEHEGVGTDPRDALMKSLVGSTFAVIDSGDRDGYPEISGEDETHEIETTYRAEGWRTFRVVSVEFVEVTE